MDNIQQKHVHFFGDLVIYEKKLKDLIKISLEENKGFFDYKEQLVFGSHRTFATSDNLEAPNHCGQVACQIVVAKQNRIVYHPVASLTNFSDMVADVVFAATTQSMSFATHLQLICNSFVTHLRLICNLFATNLRLVCDSFATCLQFICNSFATLLLLICDFIATHLQLVHLYILKF